MEVARTHLRPATIPFWETLDWGGEKTVGVVSLPADAPDKPYKCRRGPAWVTQIRVGTTTRDATDAGRSPPLHAVGTPAVRPQARPRRRPG